MMSRITWGMATLAMIAGVGLNAATAQERLNQERVQNRSINQDAKAQKPTTLKELIVKKMKYSNDAEIELAQMAQDKIEAPELKQLVETIIADHQQLNQKIQEKWNVGDEQGQRGAAGEKLRTQVEPQPGERIGNVGQRDNSNQRGERGQGGQMNQMVPPQLCSMMEQAGENMLQMSKQMLQQYEGQDFQMAFLGQQISAHMMKLAELKAIESSSGFEELKPVVQESIQVVEQHLEKAKQLAKKFESDSSSSQAQTGQNLRR